MKTRKMATLSMLLAIALVLAYIEALIPQPYPVPGMKMGLPNVAILLTILTIGSKEALMISMLRILSISLLFGTFLTPGFLISLTGGLMSWGAMSLAFRHNVFGPVGLSILGAAFHNVGQTTAAFVLMGTAGVFFFLPWLILASIPFGIVTGIPVYIIHTRNLFQYNRERTRTGQSPNEKDQ